MRFNLLILISICIAGMLSCSKQNIIEIPLTQKDGYGHFHYSLGRISPYSEDENNPLKETYLKVSGVPKDWTDVQIGDINTNYGQTVYQNFILGSIPLELYELVQKKWDWKPDTLELSKEPLKTQVAFAYGKDSTGQIKMIVDANNNLDFSDDDNFIPFENYPNINNIDSIVLNNAITVSYERFIDNKIVEVTTPLFITYITTSGMFMANFPQYSVADFKGEKIAVCSNNFTELSYQNLRITLISDCLKHGEKINNDNLVAKNEYIEIKGNLYKNLGVNMNKNTLNLEKTDLPKNDLSSTQIGIKPFALEGSDFVTESNIVLEELKGKYVLLNFWAVWCGPCREEIPYLKELYDITNRAEFEIVGIVGRSTSDALGGIINNDSITWPQILSTDSNNIIEDYGITGYPTTFLLNPEGLIIARGLRGRQLQEQVLGLLNE